MELYLDLNTYIHTYIYMFLVLIYVSVKLCRRIGLPEHEEGILISLHTTTGYQS